MRAMAEYGRVYPGPVEPDAAGQKRVDAITEELEKLQLEMEDETSRRMPTTPSTIAWMRSKKRRGICRRPTVPTTLRRVASSHPGQTARLRCMSALVRPEDKPEATAQTTSAGGTSGDAEGQGADAIVYPASLTQDLKTERAMALGAAMTLHPEATLDLTLFKLVTDVLGGMSATHAVKVEARKEYRSHAKMDEIDGTSLEQVAEAHDALDLSWADEAKSPADQFASFRALEAGEKAKLVAYATASTTQSCFARSAQSDSLMHDFEIEVMPDIRAHWTPNAALFNRFKKAWLLKILGEELGLAQEAVTLASMSKKEIVAFCDKLFAEPFATLTEAQHAAVAAWCPPMMQTTGGVSLDVDAAEVAAQTEPVQAKAA